MSYLKGDMELERVVETLNETTVTSLNLKIRGATKADIPQIEQMYRHRVNYNDAHDIHQWYLHEVTWEAFSQLYKIEQYYLGEVEGKLVCGFFIVEEDALYWSDVPKGEALYLHKICVDPAYSGRGFADALIIFFKEKGNVEGYAQVRLDVREHKQKLRAMYERNGFTLSKTGRFHPEFTTALYEYKTGN